MTVAIETATDRIRAWARECALARQEARDRAETYCAAMLQADLDDAHPYVMEARADLHDFIDTIIPEGV
jgi:hypothetical protein